MRLKWIKVHCIAGRRKKASVSLGILEFLLLANARLHSQAARAELRTKLEVTVAEMLTHHRWVI